MAQVDCSMASLKVCKPFSGYIMYGTEGGRPCTTSDTVWLQNEAVDDTTQASALTLREIEATERKDQ